MASIRDQLRCCLWFPRTNENTNNTHTQDPRRRQTKHCRSQHKNKGRLFQLVRVLHWKIGVSDKRNCHQFKILRQNSTFVVSLVLNVITLLYYANSASSSEQISKAGPCPPFEIKSINLQKRIMAIIKADLLHSQTNKTNTETNYKHTTYKHIYQQCQGCPIH